jgi:hypothetical protein
MAKAAGVLAGAALVGTLFAAPAHAATFECAVTVLGFPPITVTVQATNINAATAQVRALIPLAASVNCQAT